MIQKLLVFLFCLLSLYANNDISIEKLEQAHKGDFFEQGKQYYKEKNYTKAFEYFKLSSELGNYKALYNVGVLYAHKNFYMKNHKKAFDIFEKLAHKGHAPSQNRLGMYYTTGNVVEKDYEKAIKWYEKASKQHLITAQCNLAYMYASGKGVFTNFGRANVFARKGVELKNPICLKVWKDFNLEKYPEDKGFKFKSYVKP